MTQDSRQVLIELLFLSLYLDGHISVAEDEVLNKALDALGWDSPSPRERFVLNAFTSARKVVGNIEQTKGFIEERVAVIKRDGTEAAALGWLTKALGADGLTSVERYFLDQVSTRLYP